MKVYPSVSGESSGDPEGKILYAPSGIRLYRGSFGAFSGIRRHLSSTGYLMRFALDVADGLTSFMVPSFLVATPSFTTSLGYR